MFQDCCQIVCDEYTMANRKVVQEVAQTMQDIHKINQDIDRVIGLFFNDFRQPLPIVIKGNKTDEVNASIKRSFLGSQIQKLRMLINRIIRLGSNSHPQEFSDMLLKIGKGTLPEEN